MKKILLSLLALILAFPVTVRAEDGLEFYMKTCTGVRNNSPSYCSCALKAFSDKLFYQEKRDFSDFEKNYVKATEKYLAEPGMTRSKLAAVCDLYDEATKYKEMADKAYRERNNEAYREHTAQKLDLSKRGHDLAMSYNIPNTISYGLATGGYCVNKNGLAQFQKDIAAYDGGIYPSAQRMLDMKSEHVAYSLVMNAGRRADCQQ